MERQQLQEERKSIARAFAIRVHAPSIFYSTGRGVDAYNKELGVTERDLKQNETLDIGCGHGILQKECAERGIGVVGIDWHSYGSQFRGLRVKGSAETLPFRDESFKLVLSCYANIHYLSSAYSELVVNEAAEESLKEIARVLKPSGKALLGPVLFRDLWLYRRALTNITREAHISSWHFSDETDGITLVLRKGLTKKRRE